MDPSSKQPYIPDSSILKDVYADYNNQISAQESKRLNKEIESAKERGENVPLSMLHFHG